MSLPASVSSQNVHTHVDTLMHQHRWTNGLLFVTTNSQFLFVLCIFWEFGSSWGPEEQVTSNLTSQITDILNTYDSLSKK